MIERQVKCLNKKMKSLSTICGGHLFASAKHLHKLFIVTYRKGYVLASEGLPQALQTVQVYEILHLATKAHAAAWLIKQ